jgi:hypothetical protein
MNPAFLLYFVGLILYVTLLAYWMRFSKNPLLKRFAWGSCGGSITGMQNFLKDSLTLLKAVKHGEELPWFFYLFTILAGASALGGLIVLTQCMKKYDATYSAASFVGSFVVSSSIMSTFHYNTFGELAGPLQCALYPTGVVVLVAGVYLLVRETDEDDGENDATLIRRDGDIESEVRA